MAEEVKKPAVAKSPSVGRVVHTQLQEANGSITVAAIITRVVSATTVNLCVFMPDGGTIGQMSVEYSEAPADAKWFWPKMV